jgi:hypothetical protein
VVALRREHVHAVALEVVDALEALAHADRPGQRHAGHAEFFLDVAHQVQRVEALAVVLVDERDDGGVAQATDLDQLFGALLDALGAVDHHQGGVDGREHAVGVLAEVGVAGRVEQVDLHGRRVGGQLRVRVLEAHHRGGDGDAALALHLHPVARGRASGLLGPHGAGQLDRARVEQQLLGQRRLAGVRVADDRKGAPAGDLGDEVIVVVGGGVAQGSALVVVAGLAAVVVLVGVAAEAPRLSSSTCAATPPDGLDSHEPTLR